MTRDELIEATRAMVRQMGGPTYPYGSVEIIANLTVALYERDRLLKVVEAASVAIDRLHQFTPFEWQEGVLPEMRRLLTDLKATLDDLRQWGTP